MTDGTAVWFLGAIAAAAVIMAAIQVGAIMYGVRLARRVNQLAARVEQELSPGMERLTAITTDASRAAALAAQQVQKIDHLVTDVSRRVDRALTTVQRALDTPAREGSAIAAGVRTTFSTWRELRRKQRAARFRSDDDDPLFIG